MKTTYWQRVKCWLGLTRCVFHLDRRCKGSIKYKNMFDQLNVPACEWHRKQWVKPMDKGLGYNVEDLV